MDLTWVDAAKVLGGVLSGLLVACVPMIVRAIRTWRKSNLEYRKGDQDLQHTAYRTSQEVNAAIIAQLQGHANFLETKFKTVLEQVYVLQDEHVQCRKENHDLTCRLDDFIKRYGLQDAEKGKTDGSKTDSRPG